MQRFGEADKELRERWCLYPCLRKGKPKPIELACVNSRPVLKSKEWKWLNSNDFSPLLLLVHHVMFRS